jgi:phosphate transport system permease protein
MTVATGTQAVSERPSAFAKISRGRKIKNAVAAGVAWLAFALGIVPLAWILIYVVVKGYKAITNAAWWTRSQNGILPSQVGGGVYHAIYGTLVQTAIAAIVAIPIGILVAIYLVEYGRGNLARVTTFMVDILSGVPSIVAALFIFALWISRFGFEQSAFAVSLALVLLMLPVVIRSTEEMLRLVPDELREASYALGVPKYRTILRVVLPTALSGIVSGILLAIARVMGETAPVLVLVGYSTSINYGILKGNMASLPLLIYTQLINPTPAGQLRVWGAALTLIILIAIIITVAGVITRLVAPPKGS